MKIVAAIKFLELPKLGDWRPKSGIRPLLKIGEAYTSCVVWGADDGLIFDFGIEYVVHLELLQWEHWKDSIYVGMPVQLNDGSRTIALGKVVEI